MFLLLSVLYLFYTGSLGYMQIAGAKYRAFRILCGGYIILMMIVDVETHLIGQNKKVSWKYLLSNLSAVQVAVIVYTVLSLISCLLSPYWPETWIGMTRNEGAFTILLYCGCFLLVSRFGVIRTWMLYLFAAAAAGFNVICILQLLGQNPFGLYPKGYNYFDANVAYGGAYLGTIGNVDMVAAYMSLTIPLLAITLFKLKNKSHWFLLIPLVLSVYVLIQMSVLAGLVGVFCGLVIAIPVTFAKTKHVRNICLLLLIGFVICGILFLFIFDAGQGFLHELHEILHGHISDSFGSGRIYIWRNVLQRIPENLWFGRGADTLSASNIEPFSRYHSGLDIYIQARIDVAHNQYLNILYHQGIFALIAYFVMLLSSAKLWFQNACEDTVTAVLGGSILCYCIQDFFGISTCGTAIYFWIFLALLEKQNHLNKGELT